MNLIVLTRPMLRGVTYVYLSGLAIADLGVMLFVIPMVVRLNKIQSQTPAVAFFHAHIELVITNSFMASSIFIVCFMTVDRYISVCLPTKFRSVHTRKNATLSIAVSYVLGTVVSCPLAALKTVCKVIPNPGNDPVVYYSFQENTKVTNSWPWMVYLWTSEIWVRFGPAFILAILNTFIIRKFRKLEANRKRFRSASNKFRSRHLLDSSLTSDQHSISMKKSNYQEEKRLVVLLTSIIVTFFVTMTPSAFLSLLYTEKRDDDFGFQAFRAIANNLELGNFALNFYVYFLCSKEFRKVFISVISNHGICQVRRKASIQEEKTHEEEYSRYGTTVRPSPDNTKTSGNLRSPNNEENIDRII